MRVLRSILVQLVLSAAVLAAAVAIWVSFVPGAMPYLERLGVTERLGLSSQPDGDAVIATRGPEGPSRAGPPDAGQGAGQGAGGAPGGPPAGGGRPGGGPPGAGPAAGGPPGGGRPGGGPPGGFGGPAMVIAVPVVESRLVSEVSAIGDGEAARSVMLLPEVGGRVVEIAVQAGAFVQEGTPILRLDTAAEEIALDRAQLAYDEARANLDRFERLGATGATTELQIRNAEVALRGAELGLRQARFERDRRSLRAPFDGWIGLISVSVGDQVSTSTPLMRIDDRSRIEVEFRVPERLVGMIGPGDAVTAAPLALPDVALEGTILALDSRVERDSRTLRVTAAISNEDDSLRAGMAFLITMRFDGATYPSVPPLAIQWTSAGAHVWVVRDGRAVRVPVRIVQRGSDAVLVRGDFSPDDMVVTEGVQSLRPGGAVSIRAQRHEAGAPGPVSGDPSDT